MRAVVLAGGLGLRLRERVAVLPKVMAPVAGRPFLEYVLDQLIAGQVSDVVLSVGYQAETIIRHFGDSYRTLPLRYAVEAEPLGTGGAILNALTGLGDEPAIVVNGDSLLDIDYHEFMEWYWRQPVSFAVVLRSVDDVARFGAVDVQRDVVTGFIEKGRAGPGMINAGVYILRPGLLRELGLSGKFSLETDFLQKHYRAIQPRAYITSAFFIDIGVPSDFDRAQHELARMASSRH